MAPAYVLVGGVSHTPEFFSVLIEELEMNGIESFAVAYPTVGQSTEGTTQQDEIQAIQNAVLRFVDGQNKDVVLVLHSYGGWPGSRAIRGLDKETRLKEGKSTGIVEAVFLAAFLPPDNAAMSAYSYLPPWLTVENGTRVPNEQSIPLLFSDLDSEAQKYWLGKFEHQRNAFVGETIPNAPWHLSVSKTYILCTDDKTATLDFQLNMLKGVIDETWSVKSIKSGHEPFLSRPSELAKVLLTPTY